MSAILTAIGGLFFSFSLRSIENDGRVIAASAIDRIEQIRVAGDLFSGLAVLIALGTGAAIWKMLRQDRRRSPDQVIPQNNIVRKPVAEESDAQTNQYRLFFDDNPSPMWVFDVESLEFLAVNQAAIFSYGYSREEFLSRTLRDLRPGEDLASLLRSVSDASTLSNYRGEWRHLKKDGAVIVAAVYSSPITFDNRPARMAIAVDLTERVEAEGKVRESEANLALAQQVAGVGSWEYQFNNDGQVDETNLLWSREAYRLFGLSPEVPISTEAFFEAVHPEDRAPVADRFQAFMEWKECSRSKWAESRPS